MEELKGKQLKQFLHTASQQQIIEYWQTVTAPKYGFKELRDCRTNKLIATTK